jgi:hypothetical protein
MCLDCRRQALGVSKVSCVMYRVRGTFRCHSSHRGEGQ